MIVLWTDGSVLPNPGPGGFAVLRQIGLERFTLVNLGSEKHTTNIKMEGQALRCAMKYFLTHEQADSEPGEMERLEIHTDSQFWVNVLTKWAPGWKRNDWKRKRGMKPIENLALVKELYGLYEESGARLVFERGHVGTLGNELADQWADRARKGLTMDEIREKMKKEAS